MTSEETSQYIWNSTYYRLPSIHQQTAAGVEYLMKQALLKKTLDNITVVMVTLSGFQKAFDSRNDSNSVDDSTETGPSFRLSKWHDSYAKEKKEGILKSTTEPDSEKNREFSSDRLPFINSNKLNTSKSYFSLKKLDQGHDSNLSSRTTKPIKSLFFLGKKY